MADRTALLINCSADEATAIRQHAELERRTVSGYILNIVMRSVAFEAQIHDLLRNRAHPEQTSPLHARPPNHHAPALLRPGS